MAVVIRFTQAMLNPATNALLLLTPVTVTNMDNSAATLYTNETGTTTLGTNVVNTDAAGTLTCFLASAGSDGTSQYKFTPSGFGTQIWMVQPRDSAIAHLAGTEVFTGLKTVPGLANSGMAGASTPTRWAGGSSGAPTTGTWAAGDFVVDPAGTFWICTAGGTPGTWGGGGITDANAVHKTGVETVTGLKSFTSFRSAVLPVYDITHPTYGADPTGAADSTAAINNAALACANSGNGSGIVWCPTGTYLIIGTITGALSTTGVGNFRAGIKFRGASQYTTVLKKGGSAGNVIEFSGWMHEISGFTIDGNAKLAISGIIVRGYSANTPTYTSVRSLVMHDLKVINCKEGIRFGHYSTLNGVAGDSGDADIALNGPFTHIWIDSCDYGWIEDGQNILLNSAKDVMFINITYNHILCPRGGQPDFDTAYFGPATTNTAKIDLGSSNGFFKDCRSENGASFNPPTIQNGAGNGTSQIVCEGCNWTNGASRSFSDGVTNGTTTVTSATAAFVNLAAPAGDVGAGFVGAGSPVGTKILTVNSATSVTLSAPTTTSLSGQSFVVSRAVDVRARGGSLTMIQCTTIGTVELTNTDYTSLGNDIQGGYIRIGAQTSRAELIFDKVHALLGTAGPVQLTGPLGRLRVGNGVSNTPYTPTTAVTVEGPANTMAVAGDVNMASIGFFNAGSITERALMYMYSGGGAGGFLSFQTKPGAGALRDALQIMDVIASGGTAMNLLVNNGTTTTLQAVTVGAANSGGTGFRQLIVPN